MDPLIKSQLLYQLSYAPALPRPLAIIRMKACVHACVHGNQCLNMFRFGKRNRRRRARSRLGLAQRKGALESALGMTSGAKAPSET